MENNYYALTLACEPIPPETLKSKSVFHIPATNRDQVLPKLEELYGQEFFNINDLLETHQKLTITLKQENKDYPKE